MKKTAKVLNPHTQPAASSSAQQRAVCASDTRQTRSSKCKGVGTLNRGFSLLTLDVEIIRQCRVVVSCGDVCLCGREGVVQFFLSCATITWRHV